LETSFILITGRTREQGKGLHKGKQSEIYRKATSLVEMNTDDMAHFGIKEGQIIRLMRASNQINVSVRSSKLPSGILFMAMGPVANTLIDSETEGTGMPAFKGITVQMVLI
jgi:formylmethanofuran dehydrogenase subunit D